MIIDNSLLSKKICKQASSLKSWSLQWKTGIYPSEMAFYLGCCSFFETKTIVESGRGPDAYSTFCLGNYATGLPDISVESFDFSPINNHHYGDILSKFDSVNFYDGDIFKILPQFLKNFKRGLSFIIDGPKDELAVDLGLSLISFFKPTFIAFHNMKKGSKFLDYFHKNGFQSIHFEDLDLENYNAWKDFREYESSLLSGLSLNRSFSESSLVIVVPNYQVCSFDSTIRSKAVTKYWEKSASSIFYRYFKNYKRACLLP